jgi:hypothetical protein
LTATSPDPALRQQYRPRTDGDGGGGATAEASEALDDKLGDAPASTIINPPRTTSLRNFASPSPRSVIELRRCTIIVSQFAHDGPRNGNTAGPAFRERMRSYVESRLRGTDVAFAFLAARASAICASSAPRSAASDACFSACAVSRSATIRDRSSANFRAANRCPMAPTAFVLVDHPLACSSCAVAAVASRIDVTVLTPPDSFPAARGAATRRRRRVAGAPHVGRLRRSSSCDCAASRSAASASSCGPNWASWLRGGEWRVIVLQGQQCANVWVHESSNQR